MPTVLGLACAAVLLLPSATPLGMTTKPHNAVRIVSALSLPPLPGPLGPAQVSATSAAEAILINEKIPFSREPVLAAQPFALGNVSTSDRARAVDCLSDAIYYEAALEPTDGQRAVAQVVLNRVRHPAFPKTVCGVVFQGAPNPGCQFTFACDGSLSRKPVAWAWARARAVALEALGGHVESEVGEATHYHAQYVAPAWGGELAKITQLGAHIFYRWNGAWGLPVAFAGRYEGHEPEIDLRKLAAAATAPPPLPVSAAPVLAQNPPADEPHAPDDVGGRVELGHGWTPSVPTPSSDALARTLAVQGGTPDRAKD